MEPSKVYFADFRTTHRENLPGKLARLVREAGMLDRIDFHNKYTAIKIHFGEPGNVAYLRPNFAKVIVDLIKEQGGKAFLTDCNTLYVGRRKNALDHLDSAYENGYNPFALGCHVVIADGIKGTDEAHVPVAGEYVKEAKIGQAVMDADIVISMNHFKGHVAAGFGGALKNLGMGCGSRAGKMEMHSAGKPNVEQESCIGCGVCRKNCAHDAITIENKKAFIDHSKCVGCGRCLGMCAMDAVVPGEDESNEILACKIAEYSLAVVQDRPNFHISFVMDVSPNCDCHGNNDAPIIPDVGIFASFDPVALDKACLDAVNEQMPVKYSKLGEAELDLGDHFRSVHPKTNGIAAINHGEKISLGTKEYELIKI